MTYSKLNLLKFTDGLKKGGWSGRAGYTFASISLPCSLGNTFSFGEANSLCGMHGSEGPKAKAGVSIVAFLLREQEGACLLKHMQLL